MSTVTEVESPPAGAARYPFYVWDWPVRISHWCIAGSIATLFVTGIYMGYPLFQVSGEARNRFVTGYFRLVHFYAAIVFVLSFLSRIAWMFIGGRFARWDRFVPTTRKRWRELWEMLSFYLFLRRSPPSFIGHNPLAGVTYLVLFVVYVMMICTGFALYSVAAHVESPMQIFAFLVPLFGGPQTARWIHHVGTWLVAGFIAHHVFSAIEVGTIEGNGLLESMFSGFKFVRSEEVDRGD